MEVFTAAIINKNWKILRNEFWQKIFFLIFEKLDREVKIHAWLTKRIDQRHAKLISLFCLSIKRWSEHSIFGMGQVWIQGKAALLGSAPPLKFWGSKTDHFRTLFIFSLIIFLPQFAQHFFLYFTIFHNSNFKNFPAPLRNVNSESLFYFCCSGSEFINSEPNLFSMSLI